jgi:hypothetical protein
MLIWSIACNGRRGNFESTSNVPPAIIELVKGATKRNGTMTASDMAILVFNIHGIKFILLTLLVDFTHFNKHDVVNVPAAQRAPISRVNATSDVGGYHHQRPRAPPLIINVTQKSSDASPRSAPAIRRTDSRSDVGTLSRDVPGVPSPLRTKSSNSFSDTGVRNRDAPVVQSPLRTKSPDSFIEDWVRDFPVAPVPHRSDSRIGQSPLMVKSTSDVGRNLRITRSDVGGLPREASVVTSTHVQSADTKSGGYNIRHSIGASRTTPLLRSTLDRVKSEKTVVGPSSDENTRSDVGHQARDSGVYLDGRSSFDVPGQTSVVDKRASYHGPSAGTENLAFYSGGLNNVRIKRAGLTDGILKADEITPVRMSLDSRVARTYEGEPMVIPGRASVGHDRATKEGKKRHSFWGRRKR